MDASVRLGMWNDPLGERRRSSLPELGSEVGVGFHPREKLHRRRDRYIKEHERFPYGPFFCELTLSLIRFGGGGSEEELEWRERAGHLVAAVSKRESRRP